MKLLCLWIWPRAVSFRPQKFDGVWKWGTTWGLLAKAKKPTQASETNQLINFCDSIIKILNISLTKIHTSYPGVQLYWRSSSAQLLYTSVSLFVLLPLQCSCTLHFTPVKWKWERLNSSSNIISVPSPIWVERSWSFCRTQQPFV